jgi:hypothetical protein
MSWKLGTLSILGKSHIENGVENQDKCLVFEYRGCAVILVSDGAGSSQYGAAGASAIIIKIKSKLEKIPKKRFKNIIKNSDFFYEAVKEAVLDVREEILNGKYYPKNHKFSRFLNIFRKIDTTEKTHELRDYSGTLIAAVVSKTGMWSCHIGDGYLVGGNFSENNIFSQEVISLPENGEYENQTYFFTDDNWEKNIRQTSIDERIDFVIAMTDGADPFLISSDRKTLDNAIAEKLYNLLTKNQELTVSTILSKLFTQDRVHSVSTDDTTISLALRKLRP